MSETDSFIDEVSEEVRRDRLFGFFRKWGWLIALGIVLIVGAAAFGEWRKAQRAAAQQRAGDAFIAALEAPTAGDRLAALDALEPETPGQIAMAQMSRAAALVEDGRVDDAISALESLAEQSDIDPAYADLALLKAAMLAPDAAVSRARLDDLSGGGRPFRLLALEMRAQSRMAEGDTVGAIDDLSAVVADISATREQQVRAQLMIEVLGGDMPRNAAPVPGDGALVDEGAVQ